MVIKFKIGLIEIRKLMPQEYVIDILPSHYNVFDSDKIKAIILENWEDFITNTQRKVVFVIAWKIYNYHWGVVSVRVVVSRIYRIPLVKENKPIKENDEEETKI